MPTQVSGVKGARSCVTFNAARLWPYKLVSSLLESAVSRGINLQTHTPVIDVTVARKGAGAETWAVNTPRGSIDCANVIYATNAYTSALLPELKNKIVPVRGMVARLLPQDAPAINDSYMMRFSPIEYDYMSPQPDGSIIVGGAKRGFYDDLNEWYNVTDDSRLMKGAKQYFDGYMQRHFLGWEDCDVRTDQIWTGSAYLLFLFSNEC
jgi:glycine/D-amino acid oxidase-like deaminating enzyme